MSGSWDPIWESVFRSQEWGKYPPEHVIRFVARNFYAAPDRSAVRLLDAGSGTGACTWYMAREGFDVSAIDGSATAIDRLRARLASEGLEVDARVGDFVSLPWDAATFDGVVENAAFCCNRFEQIKRAVAEVHRVLKPGGVFISTSFTDRSWGAGIGTEVGRGEYQDITAGPVAGKGLVIFMDRAQIDELFAPFSDVSVEQLSWTHDGMRERVEWWVVSCRKAR